MENNRNTAQSSGRTDGGAPEWGLSRSPSIAIVEAVAESTGQDPMEIPALYEAIDPDALDALITGGSEPARNPVRVSFRFDGVEVTADSHGRIEIEPDEKQRE